MGKNDIGRRINGRMGVQGPTLLGLCLLLALPAGAAWGPEQNIIPPSYAYGGSWTASNNARSLAVSGDTLFLVWTDCRYLVPDAGSQVFYKFYDGAAWSNDTMIGFLGNWRVHDWNPSCALDPSGRLHIVWESGDYEFGTGYDLSYTSALRGAWSGQQHLVSSASNTWNPVIAAASDGKVYVCWQDDRSGGFKLLYKYFDGAAWSDDLAVADSAVYASFPSLVTYGAGLGLAWQDFRSGVCQIHFSEYSGAAWGPDSAISHSSQGAFAPSLACDGNGNYHVAWEDWRDDNYEIYYRRYDRASRTWGPEQRVSDDPWHSRAPVLACRGDTLVDMFWQDDRSGCYQIMSRRALRGAWGAETTLTAGSADKRCPAAAADDHGNLYLVWSDLRNCYNAPLTIPDLFFMSNIVNPWPKAGGSPAAARPAAGRVPLLVYPNPARRTVTIAFSLQQASSPAAAIRIYSITGQLVRTMIVRGASARNCIVPWDGTDQAGTMVASGIYLVSLSQGTSSGMAKLMLVR